MPTMKVIALECDDIVTTSDDLIFEPMTEESITDIDE